MRERREMGKEEGARVEEREGEGERGGRLKLYLVSNEDHWDTVVCVFHSPDLLTDL